MYKKILLAFDSSVPASKALEHTVKLGKAINCEKIMILHVKQIIAVQESFYNIRLESLYDAENEKVLNSAIKLLQEQNIPYETQTVEGADPATIITNYAKMHEYDLIVIGRTGKGRITSALIGSVSKEVISSASCPVLVIKG